MEIAEIVHSLFAVSIRAFKSNFTWIALHSDKYSKLSADTLSLITPIALLTSYNSSLRQSFTWRGYETKQLKLCQLDSFTQISSWNFLTSIKIYISEIFTRITCKLNRQWYPPYETSIANAGSVPSACSKNRRQNSAHSPSVSVCVSLWWDDSEITSGCDCFRFLFTHATSDKYALYFTSEPADVFELQLTKITNCSM